MLVMAGKPVDATIELLLEHLEEGDCIIDGGNEWCVVLVPACVSEEVLWLQRVCLQVTADTRAGMLCGCAKLF